MPSKLAEEYLPTFDVSDELAVVVDASVAKVWTALLDADLIEVGRRRPLVGVLGALRALPELASHVLHGERPAAPPERLTLKATAELPFDRGGWVMLGEREGEEIALGLVGKFWRPVIQYAQVDAPAFRDFSEPGYAKTIYGLGVRPVDEGATLLWAVMRTATTDDTARRWFRRYWTFGVGPGAHVLVNGLLDVVRDAAEDSELAAASVA